MRPDDCCFVQQYVTARQATDDDIIRRMPFACWITKATETQSEYVIVLLFPRKKLLRERTLVFCYTCIACYY